MILILNLKLVNKIKFNSDLARRDNDGGVITDPRNFTTKNSKKGSIDSVLFSKPGYIS